MSYYDRYKDVSVLVGQTIKDVRGLEIGNDSVYFSTEEGNSYKMYHQQDCCENVNINDLDGDASDLIGGLVISAEEVSSEGTPPPEGEYVESYTWTFYKIGTNKGSVWIRWLGESNGYYGEGVSFEQLNDLVSTGE